jgi:hypothetical protein
VELNDTRIVISLRRDKRGPAGTHNDPISPFLSTVGKDQMLARFTLLDMGQLFLDNFKRS